MAEIRPKLLLIFWCISVVFVISDYGLETVGAIKSDPYCFSLTWLGPKWNNESQGNGTCDRMDYPPEVCVDPLVITYDGSPPNMTYLWKKYDKTQIGCRLTENDACVKYTYYYNGKVENVTYLCARITVDEEDTMTSGCESADANGYVKEVCACRTYPGADFPCNGARTSFAINNAILAAVALIAASGQWRKSWS